ncbi:hypothetical protein N7474_002668 [Penicillium riverlandense]|uniref:uncharacterized protein n=1 Tax=Penicillium riverlandense TaxID=1903569 RepID=UPI002549A98D|nr:uncharacterized protein N7474_002668 [Penicillium riverlandense]KAJ5825530.1 hypothetical protein N7474_002668 [Penicillium riverlandense]
MEIDPTRRNKKPRLLLESERERLDEFIDSIHYSARYSDDKFEYRHVQLPKNMLKKIPAEYFDSAKGTLKLLWEEEWRALGITQVASPNTTERAKANLLLAELGMGTLRGARARAAHPAIQVGLAHGHHFLARR